jgi:hypothetical protein
LRKKFQDSCQVLVQEKQLQGRRESSIAFVCVSSCVEKI